MELESESTLFVGKSASAPGGAPEGGSRRDRLRFRAALSVVGAVAATGLVAAAGLAAHRTHKAGEAEAAAMRMGASMLPDSIPVFYDGHSYVLPFGADLKACRLDVQGTLGERSSEGWGIDLLTAPPPSTDIVLFFNGRPKTREVVRNARTSRGPWGHEETSGGYPFPEKGGSMQVSLQQAMLAKEEKSQWLVWVDGKRKVWMDFDDRLHLPVTNAVVWGLDHARVSLSCEPPAPEALVEKGAATSDAAAAPKGATRTTPEAAHKG